MPISEIAVLDWLGERSFRSRRLCFNPNRWRRGPANELRGARVGRLRSKKEKALAIASMQRQQANLSAPRAQGQGRHAPQQHYRPRLGRPLQRERSKGDAPKDRRPAVYVANAAVRLAVFWRDRDELKIRAAPTDYEPA